MTKWLCALTVAVLSLTMFPNTSLADDGALGAVGYGVVPLQNDQIAILGERVEAEIRGHCGDALSLVAGGLGPSAGLSAGDRRGRSICHDE